ncbi:MAG: response regulator transcription factor [Ardenticatenaceae bacterium]|nr:response regulator transcription factor [Ardenticatenaceae bacterium]HBY98104.1 DNA-binding response regulator [Chloroflexota bacterium]
MKVLLVDDHPLFLEGLQNLLTARGIDVVGTAGDGLEALEKARALHPDVILMDIQMPRCDGIGATRLVTAELPDIQIVMLTVSEEDKDLFEAIRSGASGYLLKTLDSDKFLELFSGLSQGEPALSPGLARKILGEFARKAGGAEGTAQGYEDDVEERLTPRQMEVLTLVARGLTYKEVGTVLCLSERTIKYHMGKILQKLHLENRTEVIAYAARMGLVRGET